MHAKLARQTYHIVKRTFSQYNKYAQQTLAEVLLVFFSHQRFTLRHLASRLVGETNVKHKLKRLQHFLDKITLDKTFWQSYVQTLFCLPYMRLGRRDQITLLIDATSLRDDYWILAASISYRGRSIPVYLRIWEGVTTSYDYWDRVKTFTRQLQQVLPDEYAYVLLGDRGFQGHQMFRLCQELGWDQVIRINGSYKVQVEDGQEFIQLSLFDAGGYQEVLLGKTHPVDGVNVAVVPPEDAEPDWWYLVTSLPPEQAQRLYHRRMWIEETFKDLKSVLHWETYTRKLPAHRRLEKLVVLSSLSYAFQVCVGTQVDIPPSEEAKTSILQRFRHIYTSAYRKAEQIYCRMVQAFRVRHVRLAPAW